MIQISALFGDSSAPLSDEISFNQPVFQSLIYQTYILQQFFGQKFLNMDIHEKFHEWAREVAKVEINGIVAHRFEGRGLGIIAERDFEV